MRNQILGTFLILLTIVFLIFSSAFMYLIVEAADWYMAETIQIREDVNYLYDRLGVIR